MGVQVWKKIIAIFVMIAFIGVGMAWAMEQGSPQFQEKAGMPVVKKHKKFPWFIVILGAAAVGVGVYFLAKKIRDDNNLDSTLEGTLKETFSGAALSGIPVYAVAVGGGKTFSGTTDGSGHYSVKVPAGNYRVLFNISDTNVIGSRGYVPSKVPSISVSGTKTVDMDLAEYAALFPTASDAPEIIRIYRGRDLNGVNKRWDHNPTQFVAYEVPGFTLNEANLLQAYDWMRQYSDGFIQAPTSMAGVIVKKQLPDPNNLDNDAVIYYTDNSANAFEYLNGNVFIRSLFRAPPSDARNVRGEGVDSIQGGDNESELFATNIFEGRQITPLDLKWGKFNYRHREVGSRIYILSGTDACEDRIL